MLATYDKTVEGRRLVKVTFERQTSDAVSPTIEVVYSLDFPGDFRVNNNVPVLTQLSCTRIDTRQKATLSKREQDEVSLAAADKAAEAVADW